MARDLMNGDVRGPDLRPIEITPGQRTKAIRALRELKVTEERNALITSGVKGWSQKDLLPFEKPLRDLQSAAPELLPALEARWGGKVMDATAQAEAWQKLRPVLEHEQDDSALMLMMQAKRFPTKKSGDPNAIARQRALEDVAEVE